jgi:plastocyanin
VALDKAPSGVKKFASDPLASGDDFKRRLTKAGTYKIICTFHEEEMKMTITVKKQP